MSTENQAPAKKSVAKVSLFTLTAMVIGSMVGAGVFSLPGRFASSTGVAGAIIAWVIAGLGMLMLAFVFQRLAVRKPKLDAGVYAYAKAGFGDYLGFFSGAGYWASACVGNVTYWVLIMSTLGQWYPELGAGDTVLAIALSTVGLWLFYFLVRRGVSEATSINRIVTVAKLVPIIVFVILALTVFDPSAFAANFQGADYAGSLFNQIKGTMLITVFVFIGVEGASVYSRYAKKREDVGRATVLGFLSVLALFASVTIVSYGVMPMGEIAELQQPSMAGVMEFAFGTWGSIFISIGLIISVLGAYLAWTLMAAEVLFVAAQNQDMPKFLSKQSDRQVPVNALLLTTILSQVVLFITYFSADAFDFALDMTAVLAMIPYLLTALYAFKLRATRETYDGATSKVLRSDYVVAILATIYTLFLVFAAGIDLMLISFLFYAPMTILYVITRKETGRKIFTPVELIIFLIVILVAVVALVGLVSGWITI